MVPIEKLKAYLLWRQKEFIEKYEATWYDTEENNYSMFKATNHDGLPFFATMNQDVLKWDAKSSHP